MPFRRGRWRAESTSPEPTAASTWNQAPRSAAPVGERVERVDRAEVGRARRADDGDHVLARDRARRTRRATSAPVRVGRRRRSRRRCRARAARRSGGCCRGWPREATIRQALGGSPSRRTSSPPGRAPAAGRAGSTRCRPSSSRPTRRRRSPCSRASQRTSASSTKVAAGEASKASIDWLVTPTASSAAAAAISGAGCRCATRARVAEPDAAVEHRRERPPAPAPAARPRAGTGRARRRPRRARSGVSGERGPGSAAARGQRVGDGVRGGLAQRVVGARVGGDELQPRQCSAFDVREAAAARRHSPAARRSRHHERDAAPAASSAHSERGPVAPRR